MKRIGLLAMLAICTMQYSCTKNAITTPTHNNKATLENTSRTVNGISFTGDIAWFKFGIREDVNGSWECTEATGFCEYDYIASAVGHVPVDGEATGEMGYDSDDRFMIALDNNSMTASGKITYTRNGEFHFDGRTGTLTTSGFTIKNLADPDQTTEGDITIAAGDYPVFEDATSTLIVFEAD